MITKKEVMRVEINSVQINNNLKKLEQGIEIITKAMKLLDIPEEVLERETKPFGNASHIILPKEYSNKIVKIIIKK